MDLSLIRPCLSDFELPVVLVDLILDYVRRLLEVRYYTRGDLRNMLINTTFVFMLNMKVKLEGSSLIFYEGEVDVSCTNYGLFNIEFTMDENRYTLCNGRLQDDNYCIMPQLMFMPRSVVYCRLLKFEN